MFGNRSGKKKDNSPPITSSGQQSGKKKSRRNKSSGSPSSPKQQEVQQPDNTVQELEQMADYQSDPNGIPYQETEQALLQLHADLIDFYTKHKPENVNEEVLTILMQFFIDAGGVALNKKLRAKYGEDLQTFKRLDLPPPPPSEIDRETSKTLNNVRRQSQRHSLDELDIQVPPPPKYETNVNNAANSRASLEGKMNFDHKPSGKKRINDPELNKFKADKDKEIQDLAKSIDDEIFGPPPVKEPTEDPGLRLDLLDYPADLNLSPRDLIEAFYSKHDESKLDSDSGIDKFVTWVEDHSLNELSDRLKGKYNEGLNDVKKLAIRRRNLEDLLTKFYLEYDRPKLKTRWTIMKILNWTMLNGVVALNKKFKTRYGYDVVPIDLDI